MAQPAGQSFWILIVKIFKKLCAERSWVLPNTFTVVTGSGKPHFYFQYPEDGKSYGNKAFKKNGSEKSVFDIRGTGGQVVAPGSISTEHWT